MKKAFIACTVISIMLVFFACSSVRRRFIVEGYQKNPGQMIKRIVIISKAPLRTGAWPGLSAP